MLLPAVAESIAPRDSSFPSDLMDLRTVSEYVALPAGASVDSFVDVARFLGKEEHGARSREKIAGYSLSTIVAGVSVFAFAIDDAGRSRFARANSELFEDPESRRSASPSSRRLRLLTILALLSVLMSHESVLTLVLIPRAVEHAF